MVDKYTARQEVVQANTQKSLNEFNTIMNNFITTCITFGQRSKENRDIIKQIITEWYIDNMNSMEEFRKEWDELIRSQAK